MGSSNTELYFVFMNFDPEYERLRADRWVVSCHVFMFHSLSFYLLNSECV